MALTYFESGRYGSNQLPALFPRAIVEARLASAKEEMDEENQVIIAPDAIKLAAMTVSRITGDVRRVLDICRFVFIVVPSSYLFLIFLLSRRRAVELIQATRGTVKVPHIREVVNLMQNSPTAAFLRDFSFHE